MRLSQNQKNDLMKEIQVEFGLIPPFTEKGEDYEQILSKKIEYPINPVVFKNEDEKFTIIHNKTLEYDYRVVLLRGRLFIKIFISPRNFQSRDAIRARYQRYLEKSEPIIKSYATDDDLWFTFVKTPSGWAWYLSPLSHHQEHQINTTIRRARRRIRSVNDKRSILDISPLQMPILIPFLVEWIIYHKPLYGLSI